MDKKLPDNITISGLRRLRESYKNFLGRGAAVSVDVDLWNFSTGNTEEKMGVWWDNCGSRLYFQSMKEAYEYLNKLKKEKSDGDDTSKNTTP